MINLKVFFNFLELKNATHRIYISDRTYVDLSAIIFAGEKTPKSDKLKFPDPPTNCCMSGCANCVWIQYAEELTNLFNDGGEKSKNIILEKIEDPNMKAFLLTELRFLKSKNQS